MELRDCSSGTSVAYNRLSEGLGNLNPGDELVLREGTYGQLLLVNSGIRESPITIKSYGNEVSKIMNINQPAILIEGLSDIIIDGLSFENIVGFGKIYDSTRITIKNNIFDTATASGTTGGLKFSRTTYSIVTGNTFRDAADTIVLQDASDQNRIESNVFIAASHSLLSIRCSNRNIIRGNVFDNPNQKSVEIYDCEGTSDGPVRYDATKYNVFEKNRFVRTRSSDRNHRYNAIQHGGQRTIVRHNIFTNNLGGGVNYQYYDFESRYVYENKMYNNTFYANSCAAIIGDSTDDPRFYGHLVIGNLLYLNAACDQTTILQTNIANPDTVKLTDNIIANQAPGFIDATSQNFRLNSSSPYINTGVFITEAVSAGVGTSLPVTNASFFTDGFGILGETGDLIQLEGGAATARVIFIDYVSNMLTLDRSLTWIKGQGVHLKYVGDRPEPGAFEFEGIMPAPPSATILQVN
ncbi:MAG: hypothetical protein GXP17_04445 [Gammaproteobacteria bacterium]|nr:hypothetical protein [Gammaproteobacteria bacterium]